MLGQSSTLHLQRKGLRNCARRGLPPAACAAEVFDASGVFETCRVRAGRVLRLEEHLRRLKASLKTAGIFDWDESSARREIAQSADGLKEGYIRVAVRRWGHPRLLVHRQGKLPYSKNQFSSGVAIRTVPTRWPAGETGWAQAKTSERLGGVRGFAI